MRKYLLAGLFASALASNASAQSFPTYGDDVGPAILITLGANGAETIAATGQPATFSDGDDTYIGIVNNSGVTVSSIGLSSPGQNIFEFDGDGFAYYGFASNAQDSTGYGGPVSYFTNIDQSTFSTGTVNFIGGLANGSSTYFSLESALDPTQISGTGVTTGVPEPSTWAMMLAGFAALGFAGYRKNKRVEIGA